MSAATLAAAEFLKAEERSAVAVSATLQARWGDSAGDTSQSSVLTELADATAEAARQLALMGTPFAPDLLAIEGVYFDLEGETITVDYTMPGGGTYFGGAASVAMLVTKARPELESGVTIVEGLIAL